MHKDQIYILKNMSQDPWKNLFPQKFLSKPKVSKRSRQKFSKKEDFSLLFIARPSTGFPCHYMSGLCKYENLKKQGTSISVFFS